MRKVAKNIQETEEIARRFADGISGLDSPKALVVGLSGDLGSGKTTFTKALARHLGVRRKVDSPTYILMRKYLLKKQKRKALLHFDAYRLKNPKELLDLGWEEIIRNKDLLIVVEWPENVKKIMPPDTQYVYLSHHKGDSRVIELRKSKIYG